MFLLPCDALVTTSYRRRRAPIPGCAAFDFANALRGITYRYGKLDSMLSAQFSPADRSNMGRALDAQSVFEQQLRENLKQLPEEDREAHAIDARAAFDDGRTGLAGLPDNQRRTVEALNELSRLTWNRMQERQIVKPDADGLPYYMPRQFVSMTGEKAGRLDTKQGTGGGKQGVGPSVNGFHQFGRNLNTSGPKRRAYLTPEESLEAAKAKFGANTELVTDIRALLVALSKNERSIAGRDLVDAIKAYGEAANEQWVVEGSNPDPRSYFTLADHPALWKWRIRFKTDKEGKVVPDQTEDGQPIFDRVPIHISKDFQGPLAAVLTQKSPSWYQGMMKVKGVGMHLIMFSPFMHLAVEVGRALPAMPGKVLTGRVFVDGHKGLGDDAFMNRAIADGLAPIAQRWSQDPASIADDNLNPYGHSKVARALGGAKDAVARGIERFGGRFLASVARDPHQALLWRNVLKLQVGIYKNARDGFVKKGFPIDAAGIMAAHMANRYAGALPPENLHRYANMASNLLLFSRSFTLGNLGVMKDALKGAPPHVLAAIQGSTGNVHDAKKALARKARAAVLLDVGLFLIGTAIMQTAFQVKHDAASMGFTGAAAHAYEEWQQHAVTSLRHVTEGDPMALAGLFPQHWNEPGKQDRVYLGDDASRRGEYARLMIGKVGEEMLGWLTKPGTMLTNKENPMLSGMLDVIRNEDDIGRPIMQPNPQTFNDYLQDAGAIVTHLFGSMLPTGTLHDAATLAQGPDRAASLAKIAGQASGVATLSRGFPGGPQAGVEYAAKKRDLAIEAGIMPAVRQKMQAGDQEGAMDLIEQSDMSQYGKHQAIRDLRYIGRPTKNRRAVPEQYSGVTGAPP